MKQPALKISIAALIILVCCAGGAASELVPGGLTEIRELISGKDEYELILAAKILSDLLGKEPQNVEVLCLLAEVHFYYGDFLEAGEQLKVWEQGEQYARAALEADPDSADGHYWAAALLGKIGRAKGILQSLFLVNPMLEHLEAVLEIDQDYSWAYYVLSHLYEQLPPKPLGRGDRGQALNYARRAWELEPAEPEFVVQYAGLLVKKREEAQALKVLEEALNSAEVRWTAPLYDEAVQMAAKLEKPL